MQNEIKKAVGVLKEGGIILYPTDTVWGIGCDATNADAVSAIFQLKQRHKKLSLISLVADDRMLKKYIPSIPQSALDILDIASSPTTIVYDNASNLAPSMIGNDGSAAIRIPDDDFCYWLSRKFNGAIASTSANISGNPTPKSFKEIAPEILNGVDYIVNLHREKIYSKPSTIIKLKNNGEVKVIR